MVLDTAYQSSKEQIIALCDRLKFPVYFPDGIEIHDDKIIMTRNDGYVMIYSIEVRPTVINSNSQIEIDVKLSGTGYKTSINKTDF